MCGIVGIYAYRATAPEIDRAELRTIRDHMEARGPDGCGEWISADRRVGLGHRRLSIIDLSAGAAQPLLSADGAVAITFNGAIYNHQSLRSELEGKGHVFRTQSDTEVLLQLYADKGESMVQDLRGMFAFGLWDSVKQLLLLARDPFGIKPLYYSDNGQCIRFASQLKALMAGKRISSAVDPAAIAGFCLFGSVPEPFTLRTEVKALPAGSTLVIDHGELSNPKHYFEIGQVFAEAVNHLARDAVRDHEVIVGEALRDSIRHHLVADVPVGLFLSAGIDSGTVAGLATEVMRASTRPLRTVTIAFEEFRNRSDDEAPLAAEVARFFGSEHCVRLISDAEFEADLPRIFAVMDQPTIDGINIWFASKAAHEIGLKVALLGVGGDELFGGYPSFRDIPLWVSALRLPSRVPGLGRSFRKVYSRIAHIAGAAAKPAGMLEYGGSYAGAYLLRRGLFMPWELPGLIGDELTREGLARLDPITHVTGVLSPDPGHPFARIAALETSLYMRNQLLRDADWASMAHSLELRAPLVDKKLLQTLAPILVDPKRTPRKTWLAHSPHAQLPEAVIRRSKTGFLVPMDEWLKRSKTLHKTVVQAKLPIRAHWSRRWALAVLSQFHASTSLAPAA